MHSDINCHHFNIRSYQCSAMSPQKAPFAIFLYASSQYVFTLHNRQTHFQQSALRMQKQAFLCALGWVIELVFNQRLTLCCSSPVFVRPMRSRASVCGIEPMLSSFQLCLIFYLSCSQLLLPSQKHFLQITAHESFCQSLPLRNPI